MRRRLSECSRVARAVAALCGGASIALSGPGCSSSSHLVGNGACDPYCTKYLAAGCRYPKTREGCVEECAGRQRSCRIAQNAYLRCATVDASTGCDNVTGEPRFFGCDRATTALFACIASLAPPDPRDGADGGSDSKSDVGNDARRPPFPGFPVRAVAGSAP